MDQRAAERSYGVPDEQLTPALSWSLPALRKAWNAAKAEVAPWWRGVSKEAFNTGLDALARGVEELGRLPQRASGPGGRSGSPGSSPGAAPPRRCGSPPGRSGSSRTAGMWCCPGWAG